MKNVKDFLRLNKKALGITNQELQIKADELEESIPYRQRIAQALINKDNANFENEKNKIINDCSKQELESILINKQCLNDMQKSKNNAKKRIVKADTSNTKNTLIIIICSLISSLLSIGGLIICADSKYLVACIFASIVILTGIVINNLVVQNKLFDMFRLKHTVSNILKIIGYMLIISACYYTSIITNSESMTYLLKAFKLSKFTKMIVSISFSAMFDVVPLLINSSKLDFNLCNYNDKFNELFEEKTELKIDEKLLDEIEKNTNNFSLNESTQHSTNKGTSKNNFNDFSAEKDKENNKKNTRKSNGRARSQTTFNNLVKTKIQIGERVTANRLGLENDTTYQNYRNNSKLIEKQGNYYVRAV